MSTMFRLQRIVDDPLRWMIDSVFEWLNLKRHPQSVTKARVFL